jgi:hypothetical protein
MSVRRPGRRFSKSGGGCGAMEAGFRFEVISDPMQAWERRIDLEAEAGLRAIFSEN